MKNFGQFVLATSVVLSFAFSQRASATPVERDALVLDAGVAGAAGSWVYTLVAAIPCYAKSAQIYVSAPQLTLQTDALLSEFSLSQEQQDQFAAYGDQMSSEASEAALKGARRYDMGVRFVVDETGQSKVHCQALISRRFTVSISDAEMPAVHLTHATHGVSLPSPQ